MLEILLCVSAARGREDCKKRPGEGRVTRLTRRSLRPFDFELRGCNKYRTEIGIKFSNSMSLHLL